MDKEWNPDSLLDVLGSGLARRILVLTRTEPLTADEIAERCDASLPTVYRRLNALQEFDLLTEEVAVNTDGNNYRTYETEAEYIRVSVTEDGIATAVREQPDLAERFGTVRIDLEEGGSG